MYVRHLATACANADASAGLVDVERRGVLVVDGVRGQDRGERVERLHLLDEVELLGRRRIRRGGDRRARLDLDHAVEDVVEVSLVRGRRRRAGVATLPAGTRWPTIERRVSAITP